MLRRALFLSCLLAAASLRGADFTGEADRSSATSTEAVWLGHARFTDGKALLTADEIRYVYATRTATASGHVVFTRGAERLLAAKLVYHQADGSFSAEDIRLGSYPIYVRGAAATGSAAEIVVTHATVTYGEPGPWQPTLAADRIIYAPGRKLRAEGARLGIGPALPLRLPHFEQGMRDPFFSYVTVEGGYRSAFGAFVDGGLRLPVSSGVKLGADAGLYTSRGVLLGPAGSYESPDDPDALNGTLRTGYINDHGAKLTDILGRPVPEDRGFVEWSHRERITDNLSLTAQLNYWSDSEIIRDFRPNSFFNVQEPDTFAEAVYTGKNAFVSFFARLQPNAFDPVQQRLPELRLDVLPLALGHGIYEEAQASATSLREDPPAGGPTLKSDRLDAYYALRRPIKPAPWFDFTPVLGGRITDYSDTAGAAQPGGATRVLGEAGFDAELRTSGTFGYRNEAWGIDGLRHLFTPRLSYRYIPGGDADRRRIPLIDRQTFTTYLPPLDLGAVRNLDDLHALNTLRLGLDNTIQTRNPAYGSRDLLTFNVASDLRWSRQPGEQDLSDVHTELAVMPAPWVRFDLYESFAPRTLTLNQLDTGLTLHDGSAWTLHFANYFLRHDTDEYAADGTLRINEAYSAFGRLHYDARRHRFVEKSFGATQNLSNVWRIDYIVTLYDGPRREGHFGFSVQLHAIGF